MVLYLGYIADFSFNFSLSGIERNLETMHLNEGQAGEGSNQGNRNDGAAAPEED